MINCEKYFIQVCNLSAHKILIVGSLYSFVKGLLHGEVGKATCPPFKSTPVKKHLLDTAEGKSSICKSVQVFSPLRKTTWKSSWKTLTFSQEKKNL